MFQMYLILGRLTQTIQFQTQTALSRLKKKRESRRLLHKTVSLFSSYTVNTCQIEQTREYFQKINTQKKTNFSVEAMQYILQIKSDLSFHFGTTVVTRMWIETLLSAAQL